MESPDPRVLIARLGGSAAGVSAAELENLFSRIANHDRDAGPVVVAGKNHARFLAAALGALHLGRTVALANPHWGASERAQAAAQLRPGLWLGDDDARWPDVAPETPFDAAAWAGTMLIPTGGTGGRVRWAVHNWQTLSAAARALEKFLGGGLFTHVSTLPPWHVSGLMPAVRALATGGTLWLEDWETLEGGAAPRTSPAGAILSFVPTQLRRLLPHGAVVEWLRGTRAILLGGAPPQPELLAHARELRLPIALAYGMTETAAVVAAQTPEDFLAGEAPLAAALPHAHVWAGDDDGTPLVAGESGKLWAEASSLYLGFYPERRAPGPHCTGDLGANASGGRLAVLCRADRIIISGGEKVHPHEAEAAVRKWCGLDEVLVIGQPDREWGEAVTALYTGRERSADELRTAMRGHCPDFLIPRRWIHVAQLLLDARGKLDHAAIEQLR